MATTIMISTSVKPLLRDVLVFIFVFLRLRREHSNKRIIIITFSVHVLLVANRAGKCNSSTAEINTEHHFFLSDLDPTACPYCRGHAEGEVTCQAESSLAQAPETVPLRASLPRRGPPRRPSRCTEKKAREFLPGPFRDLEELSDYAPVSGGKM